VKENENEESTGKYYKKIINERKLELEKINSDLEIKQKELRLCEEDLDHKEKELGKKSFELEKFKAQNKEIISKEQEQQKQIKQERAQKKYIQTTFFKPTVTTEKIINEDLKEIITILRDIEINTITPVEAMQKLYQIKKKVENLS
jgi:hypothetical protein